MKETILVPASDHTYIEMTVCEIDVVWNELYKTFSEYAGDDYMDEGDVRLKRKVAI